MENFNLTYWLLISAIGLLIVALILQAIGSHYRKKTMSLKSEEAEIYKKSNASLQYLITLCNKKMISLLRENIILKKEVNRLTRKRDKKGRYIKSS